MKNHVRKVYKYPLVTKEITNLPPLLNSLVFIEIVNKNLGPYAGNCLVRANLYFSKKKNWKTSLIIKKLFFVFYY